MHIVVTLAERDYLYGACALFNSITMNGFSDLYVVGYRNRKLLPEQALAELERHPERIHLVELDTNLHFTNYKPAFMRKILQSYPQCTAITYIDPDIVVDAPCDWILSWCEGGPAACADVNWWMPAQHPTRSQWLAITGQKLNHQLELYFNGGFLSLLREDSAFLELWQHLIEDNDDKDCPLDVQGEIGSWRHRGRDHPFMTPDQDALNIALMAWEGSITTLGPDAMGFFGAAMIPHAVGTPKPWQKHYLRDALRGSPPRLVDKVYWSYANNPLRTTSELDSKIVRLRIGLAALIGRFYRRK